MEKECQNLKLNDEDLQSYSYPLRAREAPLPVEYPLRDGEAPLPIEYPLRDREAPLPVKSMHKDDVPLLAKFITTYRDQITLPSNEFFEPDVKCYDNLAYLLRILKAIPIVGIIDIMASRSNTIVIDLVRWLKGHNFGGSWLDSLESLIIDNLENNIDNLLKLMDQMASLESSMRRGVSRLLIRFQGNLASEEAQILSQHENLLKSELADLMEKRNALSVVRKSLEIFYPV